MADWQDGDMSRVDATRLACGLIATASLVSCFGGCGGRVIDVVEPDADAGHIEDAGPSSEPALPCPSAATEVSEGRSCPVDLVNCGYSCGALPDGRGLTARCWEGHWVDVTAYECW